MTESRSERPHRRRTLLLCAGIVLVGAVIIALVFASEPTAQRTGAAKQTPMLVDVIEVARGVHRPSIRAMCCAS